MNHWSSWKTCLIVTIVWGAESVCSALPPNSYLPVYGGPSYTPGVGGLRYGGYVDVNDAGIAAGTANKYAILEGGSEFFVGSRAIRQRATEAYTELGHIGRDPGNSLEQFYDDAHAINNAGTIVGSATDFDETGMSHGYRAVRWEAGATTPTKLPVDESLAAFYRSRANDVNEFGTAIGYVEYFPDAGPSFTRAVRWNANDTTPTVFDLPDGARSAYADKINNRGVAIGDVRVFNEAGTETGDRAVRWDAGGTAATVLEGLDPSIDGYRSVSAVDINDAGTTAGISDKFDEAGNYCGTFAVRWDADSNAATQLGALGSDAFGASRSEATAINDAGVVVGYSLAYDELGISDGVHAVRWDAGKTDPLELGVLPHDPTGFLEANAWAINNANVAVGTQFDYNADETVLLEQRAVYWEADGTVVDLNALIDPADGWHLETAAAISDTGWISGSGIFDPDGPGGQYAYSRAFLIRVPATAAIAEPATFVPLAFGASAIWSCLAYRQTKRSHG